MLFLFAKTSDVEFRYAILWEEDGQDNLVRVDSVRSSTIVEFKMNAGDFYLDNIPINSDSLNTYDYSIHARKRLENGHIMHILYFFSPEAFFKIYRDVEYYERD